MRSIRYLAAGIAATTLAACIAVRPTQVTTTWRDVSVAPLQIRKVMAVFAGEDSVLRRTVEDRLAQAMSNTVASHTVFSGAQLADSQLVSDSLTEAQFDAVLVLRLVSVEQRVAGDTLRASEMASETLTRYLRRVPRSALAPGRETVVTMESRLYSVRDGKLAWAALSESFNPLSIGELVGDLLDALIRELRNQRLF